MYLIALIRELRRLLTEEVKLEAEEVAELPVERADTDEDATEDVSEEEEDDENGDIDDDWVWTLEAVFETVEPVDTELVEDSSVEDDSIVEEPVTELTVETDADWVEDPAVTDTEDCEVDETDDWDDATDGTEDDDCPEDVVDCEWLLDNDVAVPEDTVEKVLDAELDGKLPLDDDDNDETEDATVELVIEGEDEVIDVAALLELDKGEELEDEENKVDNEDETEAVLEETVDNGLLDEEETELTTGEVGDDALDELKADKEEELKAEEEELKADEEEGLNASVVELNEDVDKLETGEEEELKGDTALANLCEPITPHVRQHGVGSA